MGSGIMGSFTDREHGAVFMQFSDIRKLSVQCMCWVVIRGNIPLSFYPCQHYPKLDEPIQVRLRA